MKEDVGAGSAPVWASHLSAGSTDYSFDGIDSGNMTLR